MKKYLFPGLAAVLLGVLVCVFWVLRVLSDLPDVAALKRYRPSVAAEVLDKDGVLLTHFFDGKFRIWVPISALPDLVMNAVVIAEDDTFFEHHGVNYKATKEALLHDARKGKFARGGSTITQQMIKNVLLSKEKTITRKVKEYVLARKAEDLLTKHRILEIYLNEVEWGENIYGIEAASRFYFDKHAPELTIAEAALLAGMLPNPRYFNPCKRPDKARKRQERVLFNMQQAKLITQDEYAAALQSPLKLRQESASRIDLSAFTSAKSRPCYHHALERILASILGDHRLYRSGEAIRTTLDKALQIEFSLWEESLRDRAPRPSDRMIAVKQGDLIRAIVCAEGREAEVRSKLEALGMAASGYEVGAISPDTVSLEQIVYSRDGEKK